MSSESSVKVAIRIRPLIPREKIDMCRCCTSVSDDAPQVWLGSDKAFTYDHVFDRDSLQQAVYAGSVSTLVDGCLRGLNATVLAYGQTGSGKTYTMGTGFDVEASPVSLGIIPRAVDHLFAGAERLKLEAREQGRAEPEFSVSAQFMELYNEDIIDLLDTCKVNGDQRSSIRIQEDGDGGISAVGVTSHPVLSGDDCLRALRAGALSRTTASTQMNTQSSRSHAIFSLIIRQRRVIVVEKPASTNTDEVECDVSTTTSDSQTECQQPQQRSLPAKLDFELLSAKLHFVDLAGSERLKRTGATGQRAKEGISINCGLLALGNVISALGDESRRALHVPYRDSKLTRLLQDSLGGNSQTLMIACISPSDADFMETLNTLKYANRARNIKNRVTVNQDKGSRMVAMLRAEIQQLKLELLEYKQGKRLIGADGSEAVNDMHHENSMLSEDNANLRTRIKAMQGTIEELTARSVNLQAQGAVAKWKTTDDEGGVDQMVSGYLGEIEELRAKLLESQNMCQQLRRLMTARAPGAPPGGPFNSVGLSSVENSPGTATSLIAEARQQLARDQLARAERPPETSAAGDTSDSDQDMSAKDTGNDSDIEESTDEHEGDDKECASYTEELAQLTTDMSLKQRLIDELERSQRKLEVMRAQYEQKLEQLASRIRSTEEERDKVLASIRNQASSSSDEVRKVTSEYERKLLDMTKEMRKLQTAKLEHSRLLKSQTQYEKQIRALKDEVVNMKKAKVGLMNKMKQDVNRVKQMDLQHHKLVSQLRKECRKHENQIKSLENERNVRDLVLKRKQQEIAALRKNHSASSSGRTKQKGKVAATPASCKRVWHALEKSISQLALNKQTVSNMEREMERKLRERDSLRRKLARVSQTRSRAAARGAEHVQLRELDDVAENIQDNISYVNDMISECQESIMAMEDSKETMTVQEPSSLVRDLSVPETQYLLEKLISLSVHQSCLAAQHEISSKEAQQRINQISENSGVQQQLLRHLMTAEGGVDPTVATMISGVASTVTAHEAELSPESDEELVDVPPPWATTGAAPRAGKARSRVATASDLLVPPSSANTTAAPGADWRSDSPAPLPHPASLLPHQQQSYAAAVAVPLPLRRSLSNVVAVPSSRQFSRSQLRTSPLMTRRALRPTLSNQMTQSSYTSSDLNKPISDSQTDVSPLPSPLSLRRQASDRGANVFSRLTWSSSSQRDTVSRVGVIKARQTRGAGRAPIVCTHVAEGHSKAVLSVCCTNDTLFSGSKDRTVKVWDLVAGKQVHSLEGHPNNVVCVRFSEQARLVFSVSSAFVRVWDIRQGNAKCIKTLSSSGLTSSSVPVSAPSRTLQMPAGETQVTTIGLSDTGRTLYTAAHSTVRVWDLRRFASRGKLSGGHQAAVMCLSVRRASSASDGSSSGDLVFTGSKDHYVKAFSVADGASGLVAPCSSVEPPHYDGVQSVVAAGDRLYSGSRDACIKVWRLSECEGGANTRTALIHSVNGAHRDWVCGMCLTKSSPPGALLSVCRSGYVRLWSTDSCRSLGEVRAHSAAINDISANSTHAFTASNDHTVGLWKIRAHNDSDSGDTS